jgi:hypothetical protein
VVRPEFQVSRKLTWHVKPRQAPYRQGVLLPMEGNWPSHHHDVNPSSLKGSLQGPKPPVDCCQMDGPGTNLGTGCSTSLRLEGHAGTTPARTFPGDGVDKQKDDKKKPYSWKRKEEEEEKGKREKTGRRVTAEDTSTSQTTIQPQSPAPALWRACPLPLPGSGATGNSSVHAAPSGSGQDAEVGIQH